MTLIAHQTGSTIGDGLVMIGVGIMSLGFFWWMRGML